MENNMKKAIQVLQEIDPSIAIGGSVCLNVLGLMDREIGDLDIFVDKDKPFDIFKFRKVDEYYRDYKFTTDFNGDVLERIPLLIHDVKVCIFKVPSYLLQSLRMEVDGLEMNIQNPCFAIAGKVLFSKHDDKHTDDLMSIYKKLIFSNLI